MSGTNGNDTFNGTPIGETLEGLGGSDTIGGLGGDDIMLGGDGSDILSGGDGNDVIYGHGLSDTDADAGQITATLVASGLTLPVFAASAPGDPNRLFVIEKETGIIKILDLASGTTEVFLDIPQSEMTVTGERGLLGLAFHPDYATNGRFFVYVINAAGDTEVREYHRSAGDPDVADPVGNVILTVDQPATSNHKGGWIGFGPDEMLYVATGDGGGSGDINNNAQNKNVLLGKMLRIDVNGDDFAADPLRDYAIPDDNPFAGGGGAGEIWAFGLRNPWRPSFDPLTGDFYIADVGQGRREEINFQAADSGGGQNYGWHVLEGTLVFDDNTPGNPSPTDPSLIAPVLEYAHVPAPNGGQSITGGYVYRGPAPGAEGLYFFADFISGQVWTVRIVNGEPVDFFNRTAQIVADLGSVNSIVSFATDGAGNLYVVGIDGEIHRLDPTAAAGDAGDTLFGDAGNDTLFGGFGNDTLEGGEGDDQLFGGGGVNTVTYSQAAAGVTVNLAIGAAQNTIGAGVDTIDVASFRVLEGSSHADTLTSGGNGNTLRGLAGADSLSGGIGNDALDGGAGTDTMRGLAGNDTYFVDNAGDVADESFAGSTGIDTVSTAITVSLSDAVHFKGAIENVTLLGTGNISATGNGLANVLIGNSGSNTLNGNLGADTMRGLGGNDLYGVHDLTDVVDESVAGSGGVDTINAVATVSLSDTVHFKGAIENVTLLGTGNINATGNALANVFTGNSGNNTLSGNAGADIMKGLGGNDLYGVHDITDVVDESVVGSAGVDKINSLVNISLVTVAGAALGKGSIENISLLGTANVFAYGNSIANVLVGNSGNNTLAASLGNDALTGGGGNDFFLFNTALNATTNVDIITDMNEAGDDTIQLENAAFTTLSPGALPAAFFRISTTGALDANDQIIYNQATGELFYDANGNAAGGSILFARLDAGLPLTAADFVVV